MVGHFILKISTADGGIYEAAIKISIDFWRNILILTEAVYLISLSRTFRISFIAS